MSLAHNIGQCNTIMTSVLVTVPIIVTIISHFYSCIYYTRVAQKLTGGDSMKKNVGQSVQIPVVKSPTMSPRKRKFVVPVN